MSSVSQCLLKHFGAKSPIAAYRADMAGDARELIDGGMSDAAAWAQVTRAKLADLQAEKSRIEQSVADAYSKTAAGKPVEQKAAETPPTPKRRVFKTRKAAEAERDRLGNEQKLQKIKGGYTLRLKSEKELAAAVKNGQRLSARKSVDTANDPLLAAIAKLGGLDMSAKADTITEGNRNIGGKMVFTNTGALVDEMASQLHDLGYIPNDEYESDGGVRWLESAIEAEFAGTKHFSEVGGEDRMEADRIAAQGDEPQPFTPEGDAADAARAERARALAESADTIEFRHPSGDGRFVIAGPDMSKPGQFRLTRFDTDGPYSHVEFKSLDGAIDEALLQGYEPEPLADFTPDDLDSSGYDAASPEAQALTEAILADAEAAGIDTEALREDAARATEGKSDAEYHAEVQRAATEAISRHRQDAGRSDAEATRGSNQDRGEVAGDQGQEGLTLEAQSASDLKAKTEREAAATDAERAKKAAEQASLAKKAAERDNRARADATVGDFQLGQDATRQMSGVRDMFDEPKFSIADSAPKTLQAVRKQWEDSGIKGSLSEKDGTIELSRIVVPKGERNSGVGARAMQDLANYADATGQRIVLSPDTSFGGTSVTRLTAFYKRFGFKENKGRSRDFTTRERMIREPQADDSGNVELYSRAGDAAKAWSAIASNPDAFTFSRSDAKSPQGIAKDANLPLVVEPEPGKTGDDVAAAWRVYPLDRNAQRDKSKTGYMIQYKSGAVELNVANFSEGDFGSAAYALAGNFAYNNGLTFAGDRFGLTDAAIDRRLENMISLALKFGTTDFMRPAQEQLDAIGLKWKDGDFEHNLGQMLEASYLEFAKKFPDIRSTTYDPDTDTIISDGKALDDEGMRGLVQRARAAGARVGERTLARMVLTGTVYRAKTAQARRQILERIAVARGGAVGDSYVGALYSAEGGSGESSAESLRSALETELGADTVSALEQAGLLTISDRPGAGMPSDAAGVTQNGRIGLYAGNTAPGSVAVAYHEALHATLRATIGDAAFDGLMKRMPALVAGNKAFFSDARIPSDTPAAVRNEETAAYAVEAYQKNREAMPKGVLRWVEDFMAALKAGLAKALHAAGVGLKLRVKLMSDAAVLRVMARDGLRAMARGQMGAQLQTAYSQEGDSDDGFWNRIGKRGRVDRPSAARVADIILAKTKRRRGAYAGNQPGRAGTGLEPIRFGDRIGGWSDFVSLAVDQGSDGNDGIAMFVVPSKLLERATADERADFGWYQRNFVLRYELIGSRDGGVEPSISAASPGMPSFDESEGAFAPTGQMDRFGREHYRADLGFAASKDYLSEALRRFALHAGYTPRIVYSRETGASVRGESRGVSAEQIEAKFSRAERAYDQRAENTPAEVKAAKAAIARIEAAGGVTSADDLRAVLRVSGYSQWAQSPIARDVDATRKLWSEIDSKFGTDPRRVVVTQQGALSIQRRTSPDVIAPLTEIADKYSVPIIVRGLDDDVSGALQAAGFERYRGLQEVAGRDLRATGISWIRPGGGISAATPLFSIADTIRNYGGGPVLAGKTTRQYTPEQQRAMRNVGFEVDAPTLEERAKSAWKDMGKKLAQGLVDQFAPVKAISEEAYALLRLSKGASGAFETLLQGGRLKLSDGVYDFDDAHKGGVIDSLLKPLNGEHHDFFRWVAANRAERLASEGKEHLFSDDDIDDLKSLSDGTTDFDYTIQNGANAGQVTRNRSLIYADSLKTFNEFNKNVLDMAEQSGLIDGASRAVWEHEFYVPFYRVADEDGGVKGMNVKSGAVRQEAFKTLKGGKNALNADLLDNTLMNWAHLLDASAKNRAAKATLEAAENMGVAISSTESAVRDMGANLQKKNGVMWVMDGGVKHFYLVDDPYIVTALNAVEFAGMRGPMMDAMSSFKRMLTIGVTASPWFKVRNLIRDSVQAIGSGPLGYNPATNIKQGWSLTHPKSDAYFRLLAGGGTIHFGTMMEGNEAKRVQVLVESGVDSATILGDEHKVKAFYRKYIEPGITAYNELGNRGEAINRASLYAQLKAQGVNHAQASLQARDLMDFSMQGTFTSVRFLTQVVPFLNARIQGLYKLGRAAKEDPARMGIVLGATALASLGLLLAYSDDDDWKKREDWDRNNFWWFKFGGIAFRIPKPFEIGAIATLAERGFELAFEKEMTGKRFRANLLQLFGDNLSLNPIPQLVKPVLDVYANKDSFTGRPIETMGMDRLRPEYRFTSRTSMAARGLSTAANAVAGAVGAEAPSPVQIDHMIRGYFGWLGTFIVAAGDIVTRPVTDEKTRPEQDYWRTATGNMASDLRDAPSRYVSQMYAQARELEQAYGTWKALVKQGNQDEAREFFADHKSDIAQYKVIERVKSAESALNQRIRTIEQSAMSALEKRVRIREINAQKDRLARQVAIH